MFGETGRTRIRARRKSSKYLGGVLPVFLFAPHHSLCSGTGQAHHLLLSFDTELAEEVVAEVLEFGEKNLVAGVRGFEVLRVRPQGLEPIFAVVLAGRVGFGSHGNSLLHDEAESCPTFCFVVEVIHSIHEEQTFGRVRHLGRGQRFGALAQVLIEV